MAALFCQLFLTLHRAKQHYSGQTCLPSLGITVYSLRSQLLLYLLASPKFNYTRLTSCRTPPSTEDMSHDMTSCASHKSTAWHLRSWWTLASGCGSSSTNSRLSVPVKVVRFRPFGSWTPSRSLFLHQPLSMALGCRPPRLGMI